MTESTQSMARLIVIGTSAGGLYALSQLLGDLPPLAVPIVVVQHLDPAHESLLAPILARKVRMPVVPARDGLHLEAGVIYLAIPDHHVGVSASGDLVLDQDERVHFSRPSIDRLLQSVAEHQGPGVVAVILTGMGRDGTDGAQAVHDAGGLVLVQQDPKYASMPEAVIAGGYADEILPLAALTERLIEVSGELAPLRQAEGADHGSA